MKTVKQVSQMAGISIRTLRYYDEIGLLRPTTVTEAGYRLYDDKALERLQEIMFFKELDMPLETIRHILEHPALDRQEVLKMQKRLLEKKRNRLNGIIELIDDVMKGVNEMNFNAFTEDDIEKIVEHTVSTLGEEDRENLVRQFGSEEAFREELTENLKDKELESNLIKLYGGKDKAVEASLSGNGSMDELELYQKETEAIYRQFAEALQNGNQQLREDAVKRLAKNNKAMFKFENVRFFLLQLADEITKNTMLAEVTDKQYGDGVSAYIAESILWYYGEESI